MSEKNIGIYEKSFHVYVCTCIKHLSQNYDQNKKNKFFSDVILCGDNIQLLDVKNNRNSVEDNCFYNHKTYYVCSYPVEVRDNDIIHIIDELPDDLKAIVLLYYFTSFKDTEIAILLDMPIRTVNRKRHKALSLLRELIEEVI